MRLPLLLRGALCILAVAAMPMSASASVSMSNDETALQDNNADGKKNKDYFASVSVDYKPGGKYIYGAEFSLAVPKRYFYATTSFKKYGNEFHQSLGAGFSKHFYLGESWWIDPMCGIGLDINATDLGCDYFVQVAPRVGYDITDKYCVYAGYSWRVFGGEMGGDFSGEFLKLSCSTFTVGVGFRF